MPDGQLNVLDVVPRALVLRVMRHQVARVQRKRRGVLLGRPRERADGLQRRERQVVRRVALVVAVERRRDLDTRRTAVRRRRRVPAAHARRAVALGADLVPGVEVQVRQVQHLDPLAAGLRPRGVGRLGLGEGEVEGRHVGRRAVRPQVRADVLAVEAGDVGLGQDLRPGRAEAAGLVRRLARRVGRETRLLTQRDHGVRQICRRQPGGHLRDRQGGDASRAVGRQARLVGPDDGQDLVRGRGDDGLGAGLGQVGQGLREVDRVRVVRRDRERIRHVQGKRPVQDGIIESRLRL